MIYELGSELQTLDFTDERATESMITKLRQDLSAASSTCIVCLLHGHSTDENNYVFPDVRTYEPQLIDTLLAEHREVVRKIAEVWKVANELKMLRGREERIEMGDKLNRTANDLFAYYLTHLSGEEATLIPAMWMHYSDEQLVAMRANVQRNIPPEVFAVWMRWVLPSLNINELTGMFIGLKKGAPAPVLEHMSQLAEKSLDEHRWAAVKAKAGL
jgi:hypothetical protein